jgi:hypothetical protein
VLRSYKEDNGSKSSREFHGNLRKEDLVDAVSNEVSAEAEESPLLEAVIRKRLLKTQQTEKT